MALLLLLAAAAFASVVEAPKAPVEAAVTAPTVPPLPALPVLSAAALEPPAVVPAPSAAPTAAAALGEFAPARANASIDPAPRVFDGAKAAPAAEIAAMSAYVPLRRESAPWSPMPRVAKELYRESMRGNETEAAQGFQIDPHRGVARVSGAEMPFAYIFTPEKDEVRMTFAPSGDRFGWTDGKTVWLGGSDLSVIRIEQRNGRELIGPIELSRGGRTLGWMVGQYGEAFVEVVTIGPGKDYRLKLRHGPMEMALLQDGERAAVVDAGGLLHLWTPATGRLHTYRLPENLRGAGAAAFSPDGSELAVVVEAGVAVVKRRADELLEDYELLEIPYHLRSDRVSWSADGRKLFITGGGAVKLLDRESGRIRSIQQASYIKGAAWDAAAGALAYTGPGFARRAAFIGDEISVSHLGVALDNPIISPDGRFLLGLGRHGDRSVAALLRLPDAPSVAQAATAPLESRMERARPNSESRGALRREIMGKLGISDESRLMPTLQAMLRDDLEIFRVAAARWLQQLSAQYDRGSMDALGDSTTPSTLKPRP